jgi:hypothetical protein
MQSGFEIWRFLSTGMWQVPTIILCIIGFICALGHKDKMPKAATILMISLGALLVLSILRPIMNELIWGVFRGEDIKTTANLSSAWGFLSVLIGTAATAGLVFAAFCDRGPSLPANVNPFSGDYVDPKNPYAVPTATPVGPWPKT